MQQKLFRKVALERISSPEQLDQLMKVTSPKSWQIAVAIGLLLLAGALWAIFGQITTVVQAQGILVEPDLSYVMINSSGVLSDIQVKVGDQVEVGQTLARLVPSNSDVEARVVSPLKGRVADIKLRKGDYAAASEPLLALVPIQNAGPQAPGKRLDVVLFVPLEVSPQIAPGMTTQLVPAGAKVEENGYLLGKVESVSPFPVSREQMLRLTGNTQLAQRLQSTSNLVEVKIHLDDNDLFPGEYVWSLPQRNLTPFTSGSLCTGTIVTGQQAPINLIFARPSQPNQDNSGQATPVPDTPVAETAVPGGSGPATPDSGIAPTQSPDS